MSYINNIMKHETNYLHHKLPKTKE